MFKLIVLGEEVFDDLTQEFGTQGDTVLELEHSLVSISKWESFWEKPFLGPQSKTREETLSYLTFMVVGEEPSSETMARITDANVVEINEHIGAKMTATWFSDTGPKAPSREVITAELIYYWMISLNIPMECQHWHLSRLLTLIRVINEKNSPPKKMSRMDMISRNKALNEARRKQLGTRG